ncbi:MAG: hypothetical protein LUI02_06580, partial [Clostridiales bacterium]|nr:hypothetical protein [Clostridiales bacterium]
FSDATFVLEEPEDGGSPLAKYTYSYAGREVGSAAIVASGATVDESEFANQDVMEEEEEDGADEPTRTIVIRPRMIFIALIAVAVVVLVIFGLKKLYDNYYVIRHRREVRREQKARFREQKPKKLRRRRVGKHDHTMGGGPEW